MRRILLIHNVDAGSSDDEALTRALRVLRESASVEVEATSGPADLEQVLAHRAERDVVIAGGDGSLHAAVATLHRLGDLDGPTVGLIPLGTGNDFARGVGLPPDPAQSARVVISGEARQVDILLDDSGGVVVNAVQIGAAAEAGRVGQPWKDRFGKAGYVVGAVVAGVKTSGLPLRVEADGRLLADGRVLALGIANGSQVGGGTALAPDASPTDGLADLVMSFAVSPLDRLLYAVQLRRGTHIDRHDVSVVRAKQVTVSGKQFWCSVDGELEGPVSRRSWTVAPGAVRMSLATSAEH